MKPTHTYLALFFLLLSLSSPAILNPTTWNIQSQDQKAFIQNKGQFQINGKTENTSKVLFAVDNGPIKIYFTAKGVTYSFLKKWKERDKDKEREEVKKEKSFKETESEEKRMEFATDVVDMMWEGANTNAQLIAEDITPDYQNYSVPQKNGQPININHINSYRKIIYKNLYPDIDVEYTFHPQSGIKYALILHPGADVSKVKMRYDDGVKINEEGNLLIHTKFGNIIDHAPVTYYSGDKSNIITSKFIKKGTTIGFDLGNYDNTKSIVIDPWVQTPTLAASNGVWECEHDGAGNVYIIGGDTPMKLLKYSPAGILQWTYITPWDTSTQDWLGTLATDLAGNSYITNGSTAAMQKINTAGATVWSVTGGPLDEYWTIAFNCDQTKLIVGGTRIAGFPLPIGDGMIFDINTANGSVSATKVVGYDRTGFLGINDIEEVRSITSSYNARYYYLTLDSIGSFDQNFSACPGSSTLFNINDGYHFGYKMENYRPNNGNSGICAIKANKNFLYSQNGANVQKRSLTTGAIITTVAIPGGVSNAVFGGTNQTANSGIDIDSCGNVYVGSSNAVIKYDANLVQLSSSPVPFKVYDVAVSTAGNVIACGATGDNSVNARTGYVQQISMASCAPQTLICCDANICNIPTMCVTASPVTLSAITPGGTWSGTGITNTATGVFNPAVSGVGVFTITYTLACGTGQMQITVSPCTIVTLSACAESNGNITASNGTAPYTWYNSTTTTSCVPGFGFCSGPFTVAGPPVTTWTSFATGTTVTPAGAYPYYVVDALGDSLLISSFGSLAPCTVCPPLTITPSAQVNVNCFGQSTGSFNASTSAGAGPYNYVLMNGGTTVSAFNNIAGTQSFTALPAGIYTLNVTDANGCPGTTTITITQPSATTVANAGPDQTVCGTTASLAGNTAAVGTGTWTLISGAGIITTPSSPTSGITGLGSGANVFQWTIANAPCPSSTSQVTITGVAVPTTSSAGPNQSVCSSTATFAANSPVSGTATWSLVSGSGTITNASSPTSSVTGLGLGANVFQWTIDNPPCTSSISQVTITNTSGASTSVAGTNQTVCGTTATLAGNVPSVGTGIWTLISGTGTLTNPSSATSGITGLGAGANVFQWTITNLPCPASFSQVTITAAATPTTSFAGPNQSGCSSAITLAGNIPSAGTGTWTLISGSGSITAPTSPSSAVFGLGVGANVFQWTISNAPCPSSSSQVTITNTGGPSVNITSQTNVICFGGNTGSATANTSGGASPYDYVWAGSAGTLQTANSITIPNTLSNLTAGTYTVTVTDNNGCVSSVVFTITQPASALTVSLITSTNASCGNSNGSATVSASGGTIGTGYTYSWAPSGGTNASASGLAANTYTVTATDGNGCIATFLVVIANSTGPTVSVSSQINVNCNGGSTGSATATASGMGVLTYSWSGGGGTNATATNLSAGTYTVTVTDGSGCTNTATVTITQGTAIVVTTTTTPSNCATNTGTASASATGGTGSFTYLWSPSPTSGTTSAINNLGAGTYTVTVTDSLGCAHTSTVTVVSTGGPAVNAGNNVTITAGSSTQLNGTGSAGGVFSWLPSSSLSCSNCANPVATPAQTTTYTLTVSLNGCSATDTVTVFVDIKCGELFVPTAFSPNGDNENDMLMVYGDCISDLEFAIFDRWGEKVFETTDQSFGWDGVFNGKKMDAGVFAYYLKAIVKGVEVNKHGNITLVK